MAALLGPVELKFWPGGSTPAVVNFSLNQSTDALEFVFQCPEAATITRLGCRQGIVAGTAPTYAISLQGVDGAGVPDGTDKAGAVATFTPVSGGNSTWAWHALGSSYAAARGEWLAAVIKYSSGTIDGSNLCTFGTTSGVGTAPGQPYSVQNDNGSRSKQATTPVFGWGTSGLAYGFPATAVSSPAFSSASAPDEKAVKFSLPASFCSTYKVCGAVLYGNYAAAGAFDLTLYDADGTTVLQRTSYDTDQDSSPTAGRTRPLYFDDSPATLAAGSSYRLSFAPTTGSLSLGTLTCASADDLDAYPFGKDWASGSARTDAGAWTDDTATRYGINLLLSDIAQAGGGTAGARLVGPSALVTPGGAF